MLEYALFAFTSMFTMINPVGVAPPFIAMTSELSDTQTRATARRATLLAFGILATFALSGQIIFEFFAISVHSLRIVGGIVVFSIGYEMLQARLSRFRVEDEETEIDYAQDIAITPLAIPIISGPGAIATVIVLSEEAQDTPSRVALFLVLALVLFITWAVLVGAERVTRFLGESGNKVLMRLMGLIVMVIAVEFFFAGLTPILRDILLLEQGNRVLKR